jgi:hypothetical protein
MANERTTIRSSVKVKLDIPAATTTFDAMLLECITQAIPRLSPWIQYQIAEDTSVSLASGADSFTLPVATSSLQRMYIRQASTYPWQEIDIWRQHRNTIYLSEPIGTAYSVKVIASRPYADSDADMALLMVDCPAALLPLYNFVMAEFATMLVGNKRKFNLYQQMNGVRTLSEMQELVQFYERRAVEILENEISAEGQ